MQIKKAYKTELNPNNKQRAYFWRCAGASRYVYNWGLAEWKRLYEAGDKPGAFKLCKRFNAAKDELCPWIRQVPYAITEATFRNLGFAFMNFFTRLKKGETPGYPKFKSRRGRQSFQLRYTTIEHGHVRLTHIGQVGLKEKGYLPLVGDVLKFGTYTTISHRAGRWYISVQTYEEIPEPQNGSTLVVGVDLGLKSLAVCSDGTVYENPKPLRKAQRKLKRLQRELARRNQGGKNWQKTRLKIQRQHARIANIRKHTLHNISHDLVVNKCPAVIVLEDLNVSGMVKNHHLAQAISDVGFYELKRQIEYKAGWHSVEVMFADRWFPSSKTCSGCGCIQESLTLAMRTFACDDCGLTIDRDQNAAINLAALGMP
jgi:putative transposase